MSVDLSLFNKQPSSINNNNNNKKTKTKISSTAMIGAGIVVSLLFVIIASQNFWIFVVMFLIVDIFLLYDKQYKIALALFVLAIVITFWQFYVNPKLYDDSCDDNNNDIKPPSCPLSATDTVSSAGSSCDNIEGFYTLFTPFEREAHWVPRHVDTTALSSEASELWRARKKKVRFGGSESDEIYLDMLSSLLLSRARILNIEKIFLSSPDLIINDVLSDKLDIALVPSPDVRKNTDNFRFLANISEYYIFCISSVSSGVNDISQLKRKKVGVPYRLRFIMKDIELSLFPQGSHRPFVYDTDNNLFKKLSSNQIDAFFWSGDFPNRFIDGVILSDISHKYQLVPVIFQDERSFLKEHTYYFSADLDLTHSYLPSRYLPTGLNRVWMRNYTASYRTIGFNLTLICNNRLDNFTGYEIAKTVFSGRDLISRHMNPKIKPSIRINNYTQSRYPEYNRLSILDIAKPSLNSRVQEGAKSFYIEKGMISYCGDPRCKLTIGIKRCTLCDKKENHIKQPKKYISVPFEKVWRDNR